MDILIENGAQIIQLLMQAIRPFGISFEFIIFGAIILGIAVFSSKRVQIVVWGVLILIVYKILVHSSFGNLNCELYVQLINLFGLITGFTVMAKHFENSGFSKRIPHYLPHGWLGPFVLLMSIGFISTFLDNILAALIGAEIAKKIFNEKVHIGYVAAIVAAANAGGAFSVIGDTTTTMMWLAGVPWDHIIRAFIASAVAILFCGYFAARKQQHLQKIVSLESNVKPKIIYAHLYRVTLIIIGALVANRALDFPAIGVWIVIIIDSFFFKYNWKNVNQSVKVSFFLLLLVFSASMVPVGELPSATVQSTFVLGLISSVFDNIPLTQLTIKQGGYDYAFVAYAVGFGGSMIWFGSSAGVAITTEFPNAANFVSWVRRSWFIPIGYILGFLSLCLLYSYHSPKNGLREIENLFCKFI